MPLPPFVALLAALVLTATSVHAADPGFAQGARVFLEKQINVAGAEVEIVVGDIDPRLSLAPCARFEPFVPRGAKLWGRSSLGVRCVEGASWSIYVPIEVRVFAPVQVAARPIARGAPVTAEDVRIERVDLTRVHGTIYGADESLEGTVAARGIAAGEPLRRDFVKPPPVIAAGDPVKIVYEGNGFAASTDGKALAAAGDGQTVRVATASGRVLSGVAREGQVVVVK